MILASIPPDRKTEPIFKSYRDYVDTAFPFLKDETPKKLDRQKEALSQFVKYKAKIDLRPYYQQRINQSRRNAAIKTIRRQHEKQAPQPPPRRG